jgi:hypothetical protein
VDEIPVRAFIKRLARGEMFQNQKIEPASIIAFCLIMSILTCFSLVGNLAYNAKRLSLSNEPFLLIRSCVFLCS